MCCVLPSRLSTYSFDCHRYSYLATSDQTGEYLSINKTQQNKPKHKQLARQDSLVIGIFLRSPTPSHPQTCLASSLASSPAPCAFCSPPNSLAAPLFLWTCGAVHAVSTRYTTQTLQLRRRCVKPRLAVAPPGRPPSPSTAAPSRCLALTWTSGRRKPPMLQPATA